MMIDIPKLSHTGSGMFFLIAGPCVVENQTMPSEIGAYIRSLCDKYEIPFIFKASFKKANRSRLDSFTGIGDELALEAILAVGHKLTVPVLTDIHTEHDASLAAQYVEVLQIPAFLSRQTDLLIAAGKTGKAVNVKKGQFLSADAMGFAVDKIRSTGNDLIMLTERGSTFGYTDLVVDFRNIPWMKSTGVPVVVDVTHSLQQPNQAAGVSGGHPELIGTIAAAAVAAGCDGIFMETHPDPEHALSDGANMLRLDLLDNLLARLVRIRKAL